MRKPVRYFQSRTTVRIDTPAARIIDMISHLAPEIEGGTLNKQLSRIHHRMGLADIYCAYRAAHAQLYVFLMEFDRHPSQRTHQTRVQKRNKRREVKEHFIELVFYQQTTQRNLFDTPFYPWNFGGRYRKCGSGFLWVS